MAFLLQLSLLYLLFDLLSPPSESVHGMMLSTVLQFRELFLSKHLLPSTGFREQYRHRSCTVIVKIFTAHLNAMPRRRELS